QQVLGAEAATTGSGGSGGTGGAGGAGGAGGRGVGGDGGASSGVPSGCPSAEQVDGIVVSEMLDTDGIVGGPDLVNGECCYVVAFSSVVSGRPLVIEGRVAIAAVAPGG